MLAKTVESSGKDWDRQLPFILFAYRASQQQSTMESPFYLVYGRDPRLPIESVLSPPKARNIIGLQEYGSEIVSKMSDPWELARQCIGRAQKRQKTFYDQRSRSAKFRVGDRVFLFKPSTKTGETRKFARPFHGPYRVLELGVNTAKIRRVDRPQDEPVLVAIDRLRQCPEEISNEFWPPAKGKPTQKPTKTPPADGGDVSQDVPDVSDISQEPEREPGQWTGRLRRNPRKRNLADEDV